MSSAASGPRPRGASIRPWIAAASFVVVAGLFLAPLPFRIPHPRLFNLLGNAAHLPILAGLALLLVCLGFAGRSLRVIGLLGCATAALFELLQPLVGRTGSLRDFGVGCVGVACGLTAAAVWRPGRRGSLRLLHGGVTLALLVAILSPAWREWQSIRWRDRIFPVLSDFENEADLGLWSIRGGTPSRPSEIERTTDFATSGNASLRVTLGEGERAALWYAAGHRSWDGYGRLCFDVFNPGDPFPLGLVVEDEAGPSGDPAKYVRVFPLESGLNEFRLSLAQIRRGSRDRHLDMTRIVRFSLFPRVDEPPRHYFLDAVRLE